ncbi:dihydrodipicolinate reductase [Nocardia sp. NPDC051900]|uniref:dihydrodipicolinate reductase n=1 Tax=Nocardia sp. NPDC051900 TaxID=3364326 RepID=UPI003793082F
MISTVVWGTGNVGRAAIRAVDAHPALRLTGVLVHDPAKVGRDAGELGGLDRDLGVAASDDVGAILGARPDAVVYAASGDIRPDDALADIVRALRAGAVVVTPALYALYDPRNAPPEVRDPVLAAIAESGGSLFVSGIDPGWGNDVLPLLISGLGSTVETIRCQEIFDYSTYDQPDSVRYLVGMGQPMDYQPPMLAPSVPTMVWGGQIRLMARALGVELDEIRETLDRRALDAAVTTTSMGEFEAGTQGAVRFEVQGIVAGQPRLVVEHVTRIHPTCAPDWPVPAGGGAGAHRVIIEGHPRIEVTVEATDEDGNRSAGGNATAVGRLVGAIDWLVAAKPGLYDALDVPLRPAVGKLGRKHP